MNYGACQKHCPMPCPGGRVIVSDTNPIKFVI
jgi:hypothetical protein